MFDSISHRYDFLNHFLSLGIDKGWRRKVRKSLSGKGINKILDVATGTADLAIELTKLGDVHITGVDISSGMLQRGDVKIAKLGLTKKIVLQQADSEKLPFDDNTFDAITVAFGVRNFENLNEGIKEMLRVLKPGGTLAVLEFSKPNNRLFAALYWFYFKTILPTVGRLFSSSVNAYTYLPASVDAFPQGADFVHVLQNNGGVNCSATPLTFGVSSMYLCEK